MDTNLATVDAPRATQLLALALAPFTGHATAPAATGLLAWRERVDVRATDGAAMGRTVVDHGTADRSHTTTTTDGAASANGMGSNGTGSNGGGTNGGGTNRTGTANNSIAAATAAVSVEASTRQGSMTAAAEAVKPAAPPRGVPR